MPSLESATAWTASSIIAASLLWRTLTFGQREEYLPPGPPTVPILGNAHLIPPKNFHLKLKEWSDEYGSVFSLKIGQSTAIVLNSRRAVYELIDKKGMAAADRPRDEQFQLALGGEMILSMHNNDLWKAQRKIIDKALSPKRLDDQLAGIQEAEVSFLMKQLLDEPQDFYDHVSVFAASMGSSLVFGHRARKMSDMWASAPYEIMKVANKAVEPGSYIPSEHFPIMKFVPDRWNLPKARAKESAKLMTETWQEARRIVDERRENGDWRDSLIDQVLGGAVSSDAPMSDTELNNFLGIVQMANADTSKNQLLTHILHLAANPHVQQKARKELDAVCGTSRSPRWSDFEKLPYIDCIVKEGNRIRPVSPIAMPHCVIGDHWYDGMLIPDGATILLPLQTLNYAGCDDPYVYNPDTFRRHTKLATEYARSSDFEGRDHYGYGAGRRICAGMQLAERTQWRVIASMLWAFEIRPIGEVDVNAYEDGFFQYPLPFKAHFVPRSEEHVAVLRKDFAGVEELLKRYD